MIYEQEWKHFLKWFEGYCIELSSGKLDKADESKMVKWRETLNSSDSFKEHFDHFLRKWLAVRKGERLKVLEDGFLFFLTYYFSSFGDRKAYPHVKPLQDFFYYLRGKGIDKGVVV